MKDKVQVIAVTKRFKNETALNAVSVNFEEGKIHGIIGRNGSGKTVLFKCICGFMKPDAGKILIDGTEESPVKSQDIGIIIEEPGFLTNMNAYKNLKLLASIHKKISDEEIREAIRMVGLNPEDRKHVGKYSLGMKHRLGIAQAIMEHPSLLVLDEPMNGLDKHGVEEIRALFRKLKEEGTTILMSSHYAEDIEALCDTVCEMDRGILKVIRE